VPPASPSSPLTGKVLGRCTIGKPLGKGGNATVFRAMYAPLKKEVAVKVLRPDAAASEETRTRFVEEARALAKLDHPHVVRVFDVVEDQGYLLIIMELVPGRNLAQVLKEDGPLDPEDACDAARQIALALEHVHGQKLLHRDVKPGNVISDDAGRCVLVDFGNAEAVGAAARARKGTAHYVAPEVFQGKRQDERTDTYSLGATLFHLLTGEPPYDGQSVDDILKAHEQGKLRKPSQVNDGAGIPEALDDLVKRSMAPARGYRFLARDLAAALDAIRAGMEEGAAKSGKKGKRRKRAGRGGAAPSGPNTGLLVMTGVGVLALVAVVYAMTRSKEEPETTPDPIVEPEKPPEPVKPAPGKEFDPGFDQRVATREARQKAAREAFDAAEAFEGRSAGEHAKVAEKWAAVASEYGDLPEGRKAAERETAVRERMVSYEERQAREAEAEKARAKRAAEVAAIEADVRAMRFAEAAGRMDELDAPRDPGEKAAWERRRKRLDAILGLRDFLNEGLEGSPVPVTRVRTGLGKSAEDRIAGATEEGLSLEGPSGPHVVAWGSLQANDVVTLARETLRKAAEPRLALAAFCWEVGLRREAGVEVDTALLTDRTGTAGQSATELFGTDLQR
jgi:tRNA A-37 threonylcarbamoyl transferase component Bud32